jgi:hypothetical protein
VYGIFLYIHALNVPYHDDIHDVLRFLLEFATATSPGEHWAALYEQHTDHRTTTSRLIFWSIYQLEGVVDFRTLSFAANLALPLLALMCASTVQDRNHRTLAALLAVLMMCQPRFFGLMLWPMSAFAFFFVSVYGLATVLALSRARHPSLAWAFCFAVASTFTLASGQVIWLVGLCMILLRGDGWKMKKHMVIATWIACAAFSLWFFKLGFEDRNSVATLLALFADRPFHQLAYLITMLGSGWSFGSVGAALLLGVAQILLLIVSIMAHWSQGLRPMHFYATFLVLAAAAVTLGRAPYSGLEYALAPRYSFASVNLGVCLVVLFLDPFFQLVGRIWPILVFAVTLNISSYLVYHPQLDAHLEFRIQQYNRGVFSMIGHSNADTRLIIDNAIVSKLYRPPPRPLVLHQAH